MARTLPTSLVNSIKSTGQEPALTLTMQDPNLQFVLLGSRTANGRTDAKFTGTGTLIRATVTQGADPNSLIIDRITNMAVAAQWQAAVATVATDCHAPAGCAVGITGSTIRVFYQSHTDLKVYYVESNDDGQTWSIKTPTNGATPYSLGNFGYGIAANSIDHVWIAWSAYDPTGNSAISLCIQTSGVWGGWNIVGPASPAVGIQRGLQCVPTPAYTAFAGGAQLMQGVSGIAAAVFSLQPNNTTYSAWAAMRNQDNPNMGITCANPTIHYDAPSATHYVAVMTQDDGSKSGSPSNRTELLTGGNTAQLSPQAVITHFAYNAHFMLNNGINYAFDGASCYHALPPGPPVDVSADLLSLQVVDSLDHPSTAVITLANNAGQWNNSPSVRINAPVVLSLGYASDLVQTHTFLLDTYEYQSTPTARSLILHCKAQDKLLDYESPATYTYTGQTMSSIIAAVCVFAAMPLAALPGTPQFSQTIPSFILTASETFRSALNRLSTIYGFEYHTNSQGALIITEPNSTSDPDTWDYGPEILGSTYAFSADQPNHLRIVGFLKGSTISADIIDSPNYDAVGKERYSQITDRLIDTVAKAQLAAGLALAELQRKATSAGITCGLNPIHELNDVITLADPLTGLAATRLRITAIHWIIQPENATWLNQITATGA